MTSVPARTLNTYEVKESKMSRAMIALHIVMPVWSFSKDTGVDKHGLV